MNHGKLMKLNSHWCISNAFLKSKGKTEPIQLKGNVLSFSSCHCNITVLRPRFGGILQTVSVKNVNSHIFKCLIYGEINAMA